MSIQNLTEFRYFPTHEQTEQESSIQPSKVFLDFSNFVAEDKHFGIDLKNAPGQSINIALAFYVEATKQLYKNDWDKEINNAKEKIAMLRNENKEEAHKKTTWLLNQLITNLYEQVLTHNIIKAKTEGLKNKEKFFGALFKALSSNRELTNNLKEENEEVSIGGISETFIPNWYKEKFLK